MNFKYENQDNNTYLVYEISPEDTIDSMSLGMITNNKIPGLATVQFMQMDTRKFIKYNVSAHINLNQFFFGPVNKNRLISVFCGIINALISSEDYMINSNTILMDLDYIFVDVSTCETYLVCLPLENINNESTDLNKFFKNIMFSTQFDQNESCEYVAKIMNYLNSTPCFSLNDFRELLNGLNNNVPEKKTVQEPIHIQDKTPVQLNVKDTYQSSAVNPVVKQPAVAAPVTPAVDKNGQAVQQPPKKQQKSGFFERLRQKDNTKKNVPAPPKSDKKTNVGFSVPGQLASIPNVPQNNPAQRPAQKVQPAVPPAQMKIQQNVPQEPIRPVAQNSVQPAVQSIPMNFGETTVLGGNVNMGETTVLGAASSAVQVRPHLIRMKNNEKINLDKPLFRIGKEKSFVDYFIGDNAAISRSHASIINRDGGYFVMDTNSTNHTYVNGTMIQSNVETKLSHGDRIRFANEDFEFKQY